MATAVHSALTFLEAMDLSPHCRRWNSCRKSLNGRRGLPALLTESESWEG